MKKNYSTPEFMLVALDSNDLICTSPLQDNQTGFGGDGSGKQINAKQRDNIWDE